LADLSANSFTLDNENWITMDINGDGRPDLVSPNRVIDQAGTATKRPHGFPSDSHWRVYLNSR
jgi:hypothetical protein